MLTSTHFLAVALGATAGAWLRWLLSLWLNRHADMLPWGTFAANMLGGYLVGLILGLVAANPEWPQFWRLLLVTGFLGALTTFSTFSAEVMGFVEEGRLGMALTYAGASLTGSLVLTFLGLLTAQSLRG
ncbi:fluoride efflux transporter CrcB [Zwartia sp.]|uniref:fluoride efflux transporter CrcB n=1 Tax=Zwartia sp. TaxID=2978004 RepID=UPI003BB0BBCB